MFVLPPLPYAYDALAPILGEPTLRTHHDKHHARYVEVTNTLLTEAGAKPRSLEQVIRDAAAKGERKLFNNAAQAWNHAFFWECMTPTFVAPSGGLAQAIEKSFGGMDGLKAKFVDEGFNHFASGWAWLVAEKGELSVISTHDADTALTRDGVTPILVCDVWENAYYLDYKNDRKAFLEQWWAKLINWRFAEAQFAAADGQGEAYRYPEAAKAAA
ncbi:superoxide dismutase [Phenylobacterium sp.]|uniref:superoxide dismutase n=1 Tax=Phenylobacterium sp. TaxID=1871053 RepID=UPI0027325F5B|nr:superoxide dismutase [Phenylobacterium sp.]MDP3658626.1 superoxide dismutase [Phenylobacterium sp.]